MCDDDGATLQHTTENFTRTQRIALVLIRSISTSFSFFSLVLNFNRALTSFARQSSPSKTRAKMKRKTTQQSNNWNITNKNRNCVCSIKCKTEEFMAMHARTHVEEYIHAMYVCVHCVYMSTRERARKMTEHTHTSNVRARILGTVFWITLDKSSTRTNADTRRQRRRTLNAKVYVGWKEPNECHSIVRLVRTNANVCMCARISIYSAAAAAADTEQEDAKRSL